MRPLVCCTRGQLPPPMTPLIYTTCVVYVDIDECRLTTNECQYNQVCVNSPGGYSCTCPRGYRSASPGQPCVGQLRVFSMPCLCAVVPSGGVALATWSWQLRLQVTLHCLGQVVHTHVPLSPSSINRYWSKVRGVLRLGR